MAERAERMTKEEAKKTYVLNWRPSPPSARLGAPKITFKPEFDSTTLPSSKDLSQYDSAVKDQGALGADTAFAVLAVAENIAKHHKGEFDWSELYLYYNTRVKVLGWPVGDDTGAYISSTIQALTTCGCANENDWPYDVAKFAEEPPAPSSSEGAISSVKAANIDPTVDAFRATISCGFPITIGIICYSNLFDSFDSGVIPMPKPGTWITGGHVISIVGYDDSSRQFKFKNSWGIRWGQSGYGFLPYEYVSGYTIDEPVQRLVSDCWTIQSIELQGGSVIIGG
ncbi:uncharacterized protein N7473_005571 [Penicillium subrubescens]|uniref:Peptidase C1A papain C-terminal domain-containing protein n=1 Tax=Penicillium subrubescens TaxID=1316194 RepID=A0A1Q5T5Z5_9EURO|nr:uncharacterized protein N7473_005571 [Penicillium subrubescens]KAJ5896172.1 hypothetical protein N7473_005571 [Penicillium subrubescens]OKO95632.1 hypothetical protein PENSUB_11144 [Penicillium subrubescens]